MAKTEYRATRIHPAQTLLESLQSLLKRESRQSGYGWPASTDERLHCLIEHVVEMAERLENLEKSRG